MAEVAGAERRTKHAARRWQFLGAATVLALLVGGAIVLPAPEKPVHLHNEVTIARTPPAVFAFVTTPGNWPKWHPASLAVSGATDHPLLLGEQATEDFLVAGRRGRAVWTVTAREFPRRWTIEGRGEEGGRAWITYTLRDQAGGTLFERDMRYRMPNLLAALLDPLLTRDKIAAESATAVRQLKELLEREHGGG